MRKEEEGRGSQVSVPTEQEMPKRGQERGQVWRM